MHKKLSEAYVTTGVGQKNQFWLTQAGLHWAQFAKDEHEGRTGRSIGGALRPALELKRQLLELKRQFRGCVRSRTKQRKNKAHGPRFRTPGSLKAGNKQ